jgi:hypothetical protein
VVGAGQYGSKLDAKLAQQRLIELSGNKENVVPTLTKPQGNRNTWVNIAVTTLYRKYKLHVPDNNMVSRASLCSSRSANHDCQGNRYFMPDLTSTFHVDMLRRSKVSNSLPARLIRALRKDVYGIEWGDPDVVEPLRYIRDHYLKPYINGQHTALEIGPGGGRWTRYMLGFKQIYVVDYYPQLLRELRKNFKQKHVVTVKNQGTDFPGIPDQSVDFVFSFGTFVHLEPPIIEQYLHNLRRVIRPAANVVIHYSDMTKIMAQENKGFTQNTPSDMRRMVAGAGYSILEEDLTTMWHSSLIRFAAVDRGLANAS